VRAVCIARTVEGSRLSGGGRSPPTLGPNFTCCIRNPQRVTVQGIAATTRDRPRAASAADRGTAGDDQGDLSDAHGDLSSGVRDCGRRSGGPCRVDGWYPARWRWGLCGARGDLSDARDDLSDGRGDLSDAR